jgi:hypothetical protein
MILGTLVASVCFFLHTLNMDFGVGMMLKGGGTVAPSSK